MQIQKSPADKNGLETEGRDDRGRFAKGNAGGPGRPPRELSITQALRERASEAVRSGDRSHVEELAAIAWDMVRDPTIRPRDRLQAMAFITERLEGKPVQPVRNEDDGVDAAGMLLIVRNRLGIALDQDTIQTGSAQST